MPLNKSPRLDKKVCMLFEIAFLSYSDVIINRSLPSMRFPDVWKSAEIILLLKEGGRQLASKFVASKCDS